MEREKLLDLAMLLLRIVVGVVFLAHGAQKLFGMFGGIGIEGTSKIVEGMGLPIPQAYAMIWACIEFIGGIFLILGISTRWAAVAIAFTMLIRLWKLNIVYGFFIENGGIEYNILVIGACIPLILLGGGKWAVWDL